MESPGEYLKRERELRGITLDHVHEVTRIQRKYLEALEADEYDRLPHPTFIKGFIKSYCRLLGVDENDAALRYDIFMRESGGKQDQAASNSESGQEGYPVAPLSARRNRIIIAACVAAGIALIVIFYSVSSRETAPPAAPPVAPVEAVAVEAAPPGEAQPAAAPGAAGKAAPEKPAPEKPARESRRQPPAPKAEAEPVPAKSAPAPKADAEPAPVKPAPAAPPAAPVAATPPAVVKETPVSAENRHSLTLRADDTVWVQVAIDSGEPFDVMFRGGESHTWTAINSFALVIGNAAGVSLSLDGRELPPLGKKGEVIRLELPGRDYSPASE